jgi:hypothetical protein
MLVVDAANVVGSRPTGWWRDRAAAARRLYDAILAAVRAGSLPPPVVVVLEGRARAGVPEGVIDGVRVVHAPGSGDDTIAQIAAAADEPLTLVTADRGLRDRVRRHGVELVGPSWLLDRLPPHPSP